MNKVSNMSVDNERRILLKAEGISKDYVESSVVTHVLKGVDLDIYTDEMVAVIGSSGSGKSTLLHILGTLDKPTRGNVYFNGENLFKMSGRARDYFRNHHLGFVYQFHHLLSDFTSYENVAFPLMISGEYTKAQIDELLSWAECFDAADIGTRHMIISRLISRVEVTSGYKVHIDFRISIEQFLGQAS